MKRAFAATVNFLIAVITVWCWIAILAAVTDMGSPLMAGGLYSLKFFTTLSNLFNGAACAVTSIVLMLGKTPSQGLRTWKLAGTSAVGLTFLTVMLFLGPIYGYGGMFLGTNFWYHLALPVISMLCFVTLLQRGLSRQRADPGPGRVAGQARFLRLSPLGLADRHCDRLRAGGADLGAGGRIETAERKNKIREWNLESGEWRFRTLHAPLCAQKESLMKGSLFVSLKCFHRATCQTERISIRRGTALQSHAPAWMRRTDRRDDHRSSAIHLRRSSDKRTSNARPYGTIDGAEGGRKYKTILFNKYYLKLSVRYGKLKSHSAKRIIFTLRGSVFISV